MSIALYDRSRRVARWIAVGAGVLLGSFTLWAPAAILMFAPFHDLSSSVNAGLWMIAGVSLLPLSLLGAFKPRLAGYGVGATFGACGISVLLRAMVFSPHAPKLPPLDMLMILVLAYCVAALFLYSSSRPGHWLGSPEARPPGCH